MFSIGKDGRLTFAAQIKTGKCPRDFQFSPCGNWLLSANQNEDSITVYNTYKQTGLFNLPKPVCIIFGEKNG